VPHTCRPDTPERHRHHEQVDVDLICGAAAEGQFADEAINRTLAAAENEGRQRARGGVNSAANPDTTW